jgi:hypothetical protein
METFIIKTENAQVNFALQLFIDNYKDSIVQFLNNVLKGETGYSDAFIAKDTDDSFTVYHVAPDKGYVLAESDGTVQLRAYTDLPEKSKYVIFDGVRLAAFYKTEAGKSDLKFGHFANINDVVKEINSESVTAALNTLLHQENNAEVNFKQAQKEARKMKEKAKRLGAKIVGK